MNISWFEEDDNEYCVRSIFSCGRKVSTFAARVIQPPISDFDVRSPACAAEGWSVEALRGVSQIRSCRKNLEHVIVTPLASPFRPSKSKASGLHCYFTLSLGGLYGMRRPSSQEGAGPRGESARQNEPYRGRIPSFHCHKQQPSQRQRSLSSLNAR